MNTYEWTSSSGRLYLRLSQQDVDAGCHPGPCDADIDALAKAPHIEPQLADMDPETLARELREYGTWDDAELADHGQNMHRILWVACADCFDGAADVLDEET